MRSALRWTRLILLGDMAILASWIIALTVLHFLGADFQPLKWFTVFYGAIFMTIAVVLAVVALVLQIIVMLLHRFEAQ